MKLSGFTFIRNAIVHDFPVVEAIHSILPIVDEFVVNVGKSDDDTFGLIHSIKDPRIKIVTSDWDDTLKKDGQVFGVQQDIALSHCKGDWAFLVQADEVIHEDDLPVVQKAIDFHGGRSEVMGLVLKVLHFKGDYWSLDPWMYRKATRVIRNHRGICSTTDCCDFRTTDKNQMIKSGPLGRGINARVFHYGWVKNQKSLRSKLEFQYTRHEGNTLSENDIASRAAVQAEFPTYEILKGFHGTHPRVMEARVRGTGPLRSRRNRWLNWRFYREVGRHGFKG